MINNFFLSTINDPVINTKMLIAGLLFLSLLIVIYLFKPSFFKKVLFDNSARLLGAVRPFFVSIPAKITGFLVRFKQSSNKDKLLMVRMPLVIIVAAFLFLKIGPLLTPPGISYVYPAKSDKEVPLDSKIEMIFDKEVIKDTVNKSFNITPKLDGLLSWEGNQKLIFSPKEKLKRGSRYTISFKGLVLSSKLVPYIGSPDIYFDTIGQPKVSVYSPTYEALEDFSPVMVVFDRPMIPLTSATNSAERKPAFTISPEIKGEGRWLGTTAYQFRPDVKYKKSTTYKVTVAKGLKSQDGGFMENDFNFEFSSERPRITVMTPEILYASPVASVSAVFNQEIDRESALNRFRVFDHNNQPVSGRIVVSGKTVAFYANQPFSREKTYRAVAGMGISGIEGPNGLEQDREWEFTIAPFPKITGSTPENGSANVRDQHGITISFVSPMDEESFNDNLLIYPKPDVRPSFYFSSYENKNQLNINAYLGRSTEYTITIGAGAKDKNGVQLGNPYTFKFQTAPYTPSVSINPTGTYFAAFNQRVVPRIVVNVTNSNSVDYSLYKLKREDFLELFRKRYENACSPGGDNSCYNWQNYSISGLEKIKNWSEKFDAEFNTPVTVVTKVTAGDGNLLPPGLYFLDAKIPQGGHDNMVMVVSRSTVTVKKSENQIFAWVVDQSDGSVLPNYKIQLTDTSGNVLSEGLTNSDGVFIKDVDLFQKYSLMVFGQESDDIFAASTNWSNGIDRYEFGLPNYYTAGEQKDYNVKLDYKQFITLDRPIYRPGQKVYFKGIIRKDNDGAYENLVPGELVSLEVKDAQGKSVYKKDLAINSYGSYSGELDLSREISVGIFQVKSTFRGNSITQNFQVEEYRKPDLAMSVKPLKDSYVQGEIAEININASYYFGSPVLNAPASWILETRDYNFRWDKDWRFEFGDPDSYWSMYWFDNNQTSQKKVTEGKGMTDANGDLNISIPLDISREKSSQKMILEATVNDNNNQSIAASSEFTVHKAGVYIGLKPVSYGNESGKEAKVEMVTVDQKGKETSNISVELEFFKRTWETIKEQDPDSGYFFYTSKPIDTPVAKSSVTTDGFGRQTATFTPENGGTYKVSAKVKDANGNTNTSSTFLWVSGYGFSASRENNDRILLVTDKRDYLVGENMSLFIATPFATDSAKTLVTFERSKVIDYKVVNTSDISNNFSFGISGKYTPNVYIGAVLIRSGSGVKKPAEFKMGYSEIKVTDKKKQINVIITPDKKRYKPQETMNLTIETKDMIGNPVSTEMALSVVDKAVWDLARTELADIYKIFYQPRNLEVETSQLLTVSMDRINANVNLGAKGGSGGGGGDGGFDTSRRDFPDTAYWKPHLKTDDRGKISLQIKLPDSLTTWKINAVVNSKTDAFGSGGTDVIVSRDVLIRPFMPRFLAIGDEAELGAIVVNTSGENQNVKVRIEGDGLTVNDEHTREVNIPDGAQSKIIWKITAQNKEKAKIILSVYGVDGSFKDALETTLAIKQYDTPETMATSGEVKNTVSENLKFPPDIVKNRGEVSVSLSPSLGSSGFSSIAYLDSYPYYCVEQTTSKFLPAIYLHQIFTKSNITSLGSIGVKNLEFVINDGIQRLVKSQKADGGWGWWVEYGSDPYLSAYAFLGLSEAKKAGFTVDDQVLKNAEVFLTRQLSSASVFIPPDTRAFVLYVMKDKNWFSSFSANLYERRFELSMENRARLAVALKYQGNTDRGRKLHDEILSMVKKTNTASHWEETENRYYYFGSNTSATASVLEMMTFYNKNNPLIAETIRYLLSVRRDNHWGQTKDTALVLKSIAGQMLLSGDQNVNESYNVLLAGNLLKRGQFTKEDLFKTAEFIISLKDIPLGVDNKLVFEKSGDGNIYYNINIKYFLPYSEIKPLEQGFVVVRDFVDKDGKIMATDAVSENTEFWERLTIVVPEDRNYVVIEDYLPAGLESVNESLKNVSILNKEKPKTAANSKLLYFMHQEFRDDRTVFFANYMSKGIYEISYRVRATTPGKYHFPPAQAYEMYLPDVSGHSKGGWLVVN